MLKKPAKLFVGTAGIPHSTPKKSTPDGVRRVAELGLDAMEIEFVRGVRMKAELASKTREVAIDSGVVLTVHAPYFINLLSDDPAKVSASIKRIIDSARIGYLAGAWSVVFHPGYYGKLDKQTAIRIVRDHLRKIIESLNDQGIKIWIRPETMGALAEFGDLEEVVSVVEGLGHALPCVDFAHIYARSLGRVNDYVSFRKILEVIEKRLGREALTNMHIHISGMEYGPRGERKHLNLRESEINWIDALKVIKEFNVRGVLICESPNLEEDAVLIKKTLESL